jgi:predicted nucleic acid-binding protein
MPSGTSVFIDTNVFVYALLNQSAECLSVLQRCAREDILGVTTLVVVNEVTHKLMLAEAVSTGIIAAEKASLLNKHLPEVRFLSNYWTQTKAILQMNLLVLALDEDCLHRANTTRNTHGLLTIDSLIVSVMDHYGISALASNDKGFDHVTGLVRFFPTDLPKPC